MYADRLLAGWSRTGSMSRLDIDAEIEKLAVHELMTKRMNRQYLLASDTYRYRTTYTPLPAITRPTALLASKPLRSRPVVSPVAFPFVTGQYQRTPCLGGFSYRHDHSPVASYDSRSLLLPSVQHRHAVRRRWRIYGSMLIFYFMLKRNLRLAKRKPTYQQHEYRRIRFLELLTGIHRVYLDPNCSIYQTLSSVVRASTELLNEPALFTAVRTIVDQITNFQPRKGIVGTCSDECVLLYLLNCSLEQYPPTYFWSIEKHLFALSYSRMKLHGDARLDAFTTKFLLLSVFIFRGLTKTLLLKPIKYRLTRSELNSMQWLNLRLLSSLILYVTRHAVIYKEGGDGLPMPFPMEMKDVLIDDETLRAGFINLDELVASTAPKLSAWGNEYARRLQQHLRAKRRRS